MCLLELLVGFVVSFENLDNTFNLEDGSNGFIFSNETDTQNTVPLKVVDCWGWIFGFDPNNAGLDLWGWAEVIFSDLHQVIYLAQQLYVHGEPAIEFIVGFSYESLREFLLKHQNSAPEKWSVGEQLEYYRR